MRPLSARGRVVLGATLIALALGVAAFYHFSKPEHPSAKITVTPAGPVAPGTLVTLDASAATGDTLLWDTADVDPSLFRRDSDGRALVFSAKTAGRYQFRLDVMGIRHGRIDAGRTSVTVVVQETAPPAPPAPGPGPSPVPPSPSPSPSPGIDELGLTAKTAEILAKRSWSGDAARDASLDFRQHRLAPIFANAAASAASFPSGQAVLADTEAKYKAAIGPAAWTDWSSFLFAPLAAELKALGQAGKLPNVASLAEAFSEIATALEASN